MTGHPSTRTLVAVVAVALVWASAACSSSGARGAASSSSGGTTVSTTTARPCSSAPTAGSEASAAALAAPGAVVSGASAAPRAPKLALTEVATLQAPTAIATRCDERSLYVAEQSGRVVRVALDRPPVSDDSSDGNETVLDVSGRVTSGGEQGLLGLVFTADGSTLYIAYTNTDANQELDRFTVGTGGAVDPASRQEILTIADFAPNHNGGQLAIDDHGYLYWGMGDGGGGGDPHHSGQDPSDLLGDILRIDPQHPSGGRAYGIPPGNPFATGGKGAPEVYQYGLRNPWRFSFDPATGDEWIADVGQDKYEEIDHVTPAEAPGANFGWSAREGRHPYGDAAAPAGAIDPVFEYDHSEGRCAVIGGYVYRGDKIADLQGTYLYGDACSGDIEGLRLQPDGTAVEVPIGLAVGQLSTFGVDVDGELYAASLDGTLVRIDAA